MVSLLLGYAQKNNMILKVGKTAEDHYYSLCIAIKNSNIEIVQLLMNNAKENSLIFELNEKTKDG